MYEEVNSTESKKHLSRES